MQKLLLLCLMLVALGLVGCGDTCKDLCVKVNKCRTANGDAVDADCEHNCTEIEVSDDVDSVRDCIMDHSCADLDTGGHCGGSDGRKLPK